MEVGGGGGRRGGRGRSLYVPARNDVTESEPVWPSGKASGW